MYKFEYECTNNGDNIINNIHNLYSGCLFKNVFCIFIMYTFDHKDNIIKNISMYIRSCQKYKYLTI